MDNAILLSAALLIGLLVGGVGAWFLASRPAADMRARLGEAEERARTSEASLAETRAQLSAAVERASRSDDLARELDETRTKRAALSERLAQIEATASEREKAHAEQKAALVQAREAMLSEFKATGAEVLKANQDEFLKRAEARFKESEATGEAKIKALLSPVGERLEKYEKQVETLEKQRVDAFGRLYQQIAEMQRGQDAVRREAERLGSSLRAAPKASGRWGELQVKNVLEKCGLSEHYDFVAEKSVLTEGGRLRPDFIVDIPGGKQVIIDSKNIWRSYDASLNAETEEEKNRLLKEHTTVLRNHIKALSQKSYFAEFEGSSDYVVLFVPGEHLLYSALERDETLWNLAFESNVLLATPTNLVAICRTVATVWQHEGLAQNAREIGKIGSNLYDSLAKTQEDIVGMGNALQTAVGRYNRFTTTYDSNVMSRARMLREKDIAIKKREVEDGVHQIEATAQLPQQVSE